MTPAPMTLASLFNDIMLFGIFLIVGFIIREFVRPFQRWFLPSSVIGGCVALLVGQQMLGLVEIPKTFEGFNGILMRIIMTSVVLGVSVTAKRLKNHLDYTFANIILYGAQIMIGLVLAAFFSSIWPGLPEGWGILGVFSFFGSHGSAGAAAAVMEEMGQSGAMGVGMILATGGLIFSMTAGMFVVNMGIRKGWASFVKEPQAQPEHFYRGALPKDKREPIGYTTTTPVSINPIALHLALIMLCYFLGMHLFKLLILAVPILSKVNAMLYGMIGGLIVWPLLCKTGLDSYMDKKIINQISGFSLEILILCSIATLPLDLVTAYAIPLIGFVVISCTVTALFCIWFFKKIGGEQWFEKAVMVLGICTGSSANGLALVRAMDPNSESCVAEAHGVYNALFWWNNLLTPILPAMVLAHGFGKVMGIGAAFVVVTTVLSIIVFRNNRQGVVS